MPVMMSASGARGILLGLLLLAYAAGASGEVTGRWSWYDKVVYINCQSSSTEELIAVQQLEAVDIPPFNYTEMQKRYGDNNLTLLGAKLELYHCPYPRGSFMEALAALQYPVAVLQELKVLSFSSSPLPRAEHFAGLYLRTLSISVESASYTLPTPHLNPDIFSSQAELSELMIQGVILLPMPTISRLRRMELLWGESAGALGDCAELLELKLVEWKVPATVGNEGWLANCPKLSTVRAYGMPASWVIQALRGARAMTSLDISNEVEKLMPLESMLSGLPLQQLTLPYEMFKRLSENTLSTSLEKITLSDPDWSSDEEEKQRVVRRLARLPALRHLATQYGYKADFCKLFPEYGSLPALRQLTLSGTGTSKLCFNSWDSLEYLDLSDTKVSVLELMQLPPAREHSLLVDLRRTDTWRTPVGDIPLDEAGYNLLRDKLNEVLTV